MGTLSSTKLVALNSGCTLESYNSKHIPMPAPSKPVKFGLQGVHAGKNC